MVLEVPEGFKEVRSSLQAAGVGLRRFLGGLGRGLGGDQNPWFLGLRGEVGGGLKADTSRPEAPRRELADFLVVVVTK